MYTAIHLLFNKIQGILFYYPHEGGRETAPRTLNAKTNKGEDSDEKDLVSDHDPFGLNIFWADRLVPDSQLHNLHFLPESENVRFCEINKLPKRWKDRIKGFVFFDANYRHISNNKLRILKMDEMEGTEPLYHHYYPTLS